MPICPECKSKYKGKPEACPGCGAELPADKTKRSFIQKSDNYYDYESSGLRLPFKTVIKLTVGIFVIIFIGGFIVGLMSDGEDIEQKEPPSEEVSENSLQQYDPGLPEVKTEELFDYNQVKPWNGESEYSNSDEDLIRDLFMTIAKANLKEDMNLFQEGYSDAFPDWETKRKKTLAMWHKYDFHKLAYYITELNVNGNQANTSLIWSITLKEKGESSRETETTNDAILQKEHGAWKIINLN